MKEARLQAIFFDFDGVIVDSFGIALEVNRLERPAMTEDQYRASFNGNINEAQHQAPKVRDIDFVAEYHARFSQLQLDEERRGVIERLAARVPLFIISSSTSRTISDFLTRHGVRERFTKILGNEVHASKVHKFRLLFEEYALDPARVAFITDSSGDIREAREAGIGRVIGILGGYQTREMLEAARPDELVKNFTEFEREIQKFKNKYA